MHIYGQAAQARGLTYTGGKVLAAEVGLPPYLEGKYSHVYGFEFTAPAAK